MLRHITNTQGPYRKLVHLIYRKSRHQYEAAGLSDDSPSHGVHFWCHKARLACEELDFQELWSHPSVLASMDRKEFKTTLDTLTSVYSNNRLRDAILRKPHLSNTADLFPSKRFADKIYGSNLQFE